MSDQIETNGHNGEHSPERVVGAQLLLQWRTRYQQITECAANSERRGRTVGSQQLRAQAFGIKICADELKAKFKL